MRFLPLIRKVFEQSRFDFSINKFICHKVIMANNSILYTNNLENEHLNIELKMMNTSDSLLINWITKNKHFLLAILILVSLIVNLIIFLCLISTVRSNVGSAQIQLKVENQNKTETPPTTLWSTCGNWKAYTDIKCLKVFDQMTTYAEAVSLCQKNDPAASLLMIQTKEEQAFVEEHIFTEFQLFNSVWLGELLHLVPNATGESNYTDDNNKSNAQFPLYSNWAEGSPSQLSGRQCIQMLADHHTVGGAGKWVNIRCQQMGAVVYQRLQNWPLSKFQETLLRITRENERMKMAIIQPGFIYVQLPMQAPPTEMWPYLNWVDISSEYANVFFRVVGNESAEFGALQNESSPRLKKVKMDKHEIGLVEIIVDDSDEITPGIMSNGVTIITGIYNDSYENLKKLKFLVENSET